MSPDQIRDAVLPWGFEETDLVDLGKNYLIQFTAR
jgi:hypothetical protein